MDDQMLKRIIMEKDEPVRTGMVKPKRKDS